MKVKTSITLSEELINALEENSENFKNRSEFIETASWKFIEQIMRQKREAQDLAIINRHAKRLNQEALEVLSYQVEA
ncbi:hypothetical protein JNL27_09290 [bacterium]|nr:hypothetical protein [bacterium]